MSTGLSSNSSVSVGEPKSVRWVVRSTEVSVSAANVGTGFSLEAKVTGSTAVSESLASEVGDEEGRSLDVVLGTGTGENPAVFDCDTTGTSTSPSSMVLAVGPTSAERTGDSRDEAGGEMNAIMYISTLDSLAKTFPSAAGGVVRLEETDAGETSCSEGSDSGGEGGRGRGKGGVEASYMGSSGKGGEALDDFTDMDRSSRSSSRSGSVGLGLLSRSLKSDVISDAARAVTTAVVSGAILGEVPGEVEAEAEWEDLGGDLRSVRTRAAGLAPLGRLLSLV